jgi:hypothetical protein
MGPHLCSIIRKMHLCAGSRLSSRSLGKIRPENAVLSWKISTARGPYLCFIIRKLNVCACDSLSSRSLGKIGAEIAVLSWNNF